MPTNSKLNYIKNKNDYKMLGFQYYDEYGLVSIPLIDKVPIIKSWQTLKETIEPVYCTNNTGLLCGEINGFFVLDIEKDGIPDWLELIKNKPEIQTPTVETGNGGYHLYFKYDPDIKNKIKLKINGKKVDMDVLTTGKQVVAPPSVISSKKYKWIISMEDVRIKKIPTWLKKIINA